MEVKLILKCDKLLIKHLKITKKIGEKLNLRKEAPKRGLPDRKQNCQNLNQTLFMFPKTCFFNQKQKCTT
jgi:hypothetical protein